MLLNKQLENFHVILASQSPRRQELLKGLELDFEIKVISNIDESYPNDLEKKDIPCYLANKKSESYLHILNDSKNILITADTLVFHDGKVLEKPKDLDDAVRMISSLSNGVHEVITGICLRQKSKFITFSDHTKVRFAKLSREEIEYYVNTFRPMDKAGSYGVQEWIGYVGIESIEGSYFNVMGLPVHLLYRKLKEFINPA